MLLVIFLIVGLMKSLEATDHSEHSTKMTGKESFTSTLGKPQKKYFFSGPTTKRGGGGKGPITKEKGTF